MATILVVEDEGSIRTFIERTLKHLGHSTVCCETLGEAQDVYDPEAFALVISDIHLGRDNATQWVLQLRDQTPAITISGKAEVPGVENLQKPFSMLILREKVRRLLPT